MWRLNLLPDRGILGTKSDPKERLSKNRDLIAAIGQLSEDSRKKLSRSLARTKTDDKDRLQKAYHSLQLYYKYGDTKTLRELELATVEELFSASQKKAKKKEQGSQTEDTQKNEEVSTDNAPIKPRELDEIISDAIVNGDEEALGNLQELFEALNTHYDPETEENDDEIPSISGIFSDRSIVLDNHQTDLRKLVGKFCSMSSWGGFMKTDESVLKDAVSADIVSSKCFNPSSDDSIISFMGGIDGNQPLFDFIKQFDNQFDIKGLDTAERFAPIIENLCTQREKLLASLDMVMYHPVLLFGSSDEHKQILIEYVRAWQKLYHAFCVNEPMMRQISPQGTNFIARAILLLDVLYVKTPTEWKGILLPLHPIYLWRYFEVFSFLPSQKANWSDDDKLDDRDALKTVLSQLPQVLSFIIANSVVTSAEEDVGEDRVLPCSGSIEMLPTFENKTNRYLGNDGSGIASESAANRVPCAGA